MSSDITVFYKENDLFAQLEIDREYEDYPREMIYSGDHYPQQPEFFWQNPVNWLFPIVLLVVMLSVFLVATKTFSSDASHVGETAVTLTNHPSATKNDIGVGALAFSAPYTDYTITQGLHGISYGHLAIDIAAGRGEPILSPINGTVTQLFIDEYGNPTLVIENEVFQVTFLHGDYVVSLGDILVEGQVLGAESNKGYTMDMAGNLCYNREWCGNHTHLNVFDKRIQANVNPLDLFDN